VAVENGVDRGEFQLNKIMYMKRRESRRRYLGGEKGNILLA